MPTARAASSTLRWVSNAATASSILRLNFAPWPPHLQSPAITWTPTPAIATPSLFAISGRIALLSGRPGVMHVLIAGNQRPRRKHDID
jgi:hypothetical protein